MKILVFDIEANGLIEDADTIWCICARDISSKNEYIFTGESLTKDNIVSLFSNSKLIGHNIIGYDIPIIEKFYDINLIDLVGKENIIDTYIWSSTLNPDRQLPIGCPTVVANPVTKKGKKIGPHGLEAWGYNVGFKKIEIHDWNVFTNHIVERCMGDVHINELVYYKLLKEAGFEAL
ncbi:DNA polymerase [Caudoviricetes sp.]|nr:DNA polymerase [Caudoviricetes sp.]